MSHPASEGLRQLADKLDKIASEDGVILDVTPQFRLGKADFSLACRRLDLVTEPMKESDYFVNAIGKIGGLELRGHAYRDEMCVKKTVMKAVEVWVCGDEDAAVAE